MADTMEIAPNNIIPALPPLPGTALLVNFPHAGHGQNWLLANAGTTVTAITTPQPPP